MAGRQGRQLFRILTLSGKREKENMVQETSSLYTIGIHRIDLRIAAAYTRLKKLR